MRIKEEWKEFEIIVRRVTPKRYHNLMGHKLFPYFIFGYPVVFFLCFVLVYYFLQPAANGG